MGRYVVLVATTSLLLGILFMAAIAMIAAIPTPRATAPDKAAEHTTVFIAKLIAERLKNFGALAVEDSGSVRLQHLFMRGSAQVPPELCNGERSLCDSLAEALHDVVVGFASDDSTALRQACEREWGKRCSGVLSGVVIEGHADRTPYDARAEGSNGALAVERAAAVYHEVVVRRPSLAGDPVEGFGKLLAFAGYSCSRPAFNTESHLRFELTSNQREEHCEDQGDPDNEDEEAKNRRIEIRLVVRP